MIREIEINFEKLEKLVENFNRLSEREFEVVTLLSQKLSSKAIGELLCISSHTVDCHRRKIISKLEIIDTKCLQFLLIKNKALHKAH